MPIRELPEKSFYLASYPRSGNTWMMYSLSMLFSAIRAEARSSFDLYHFQYGREDLNNFFFRCERQMDMRVPLIIKTHESPDVYQSIYPPRKCIYIYRDGRDVLLSYYFYKKMFAEKHVIEYTTIANKVEPIAKGTKQLDFDPREFTLFLKENACEWASHVKGWLEIETVLPVRYEDLHADFEIILESIIEYLNIQPSVEIKIIHQEYVKNFGQHFSGKNDSFFRKGIVGDWRNYFSDEHHKLFMELVGDLFHEFGYLV